MAAAALNRLGRDVPSRLLEPETWTPPSRRGSSACRCARTTWRCCRCCRPSETRVGDVRPHRTRDAALAWWGVQRARRRSSPPRRWTRDAARFCWQRRRPTHALRRAVRRRGEVAGLGALVAADLRAVGAEEILAALRSDSPLLRSPDAYGPASDASAPAAPLAASAY
ncbi:MAG: hypothetical protein WKH64_04625 [Chloroflexia bacterium]